MKTLNRINIILAVIAGVITLGEKVYETTKTVRELRRKKKRGFGFYGQN